MNLQNLVTLRGYVLFLPFATGSKSESIRPALVNGHEPTLSLYKEGDNPFENKSLHQYHRKYVETLGDIDLEKRKFLVHEIKELPDPVSIGQERDATSLGSGEEQLEKEIESKDSTTEGELEE